jgi:hypothetical protein
MQRGAWELRFFGVNSLFMAQSQYHQAPQAFACTTMHSNFLISIVLLWPAFSSNADAGFLDNPEDFFGCPPRTMGAVV